MRQVVVTKDKLPLAFVGDEAEIDHIPFAEIIYIKEMIDASSTEYATKSSMIFSHVMQIATSDDGYNSGRIYYLSAGSKETLAEFISDLTKKPEVCRLQAKARTSFQKIQLRVRNHYESHKFQGLMALFIVLVSYLEHIQVFLKPRPGPDDEIMMMLRV